jgi:glucose/arabinose dehydrogenase
MSRFWIVTVLSIVTLAGCAGTGTPRVTPTVAPAATGTPGPQPSAAFGQTSPSAAPAATGTRAHSSTPSSTHTAPTEAPATPASATNPVAASTRVVAPAGQINLPPGFGLSVFAGGLDTPRNLAIGPDGQLYVAERGRGRIVRLPDRNHDGVSDGIEVIAQGFNTPSSLAFYKDGSLYVSTATQVFRLSQPDANGVFQKREVVIDGLPGPQDHFTRTLFFSPDWSSLFIQIGSSCNICNESDSRRATIMRFNPEGSGGAIYARGLRNAVGITFRPGTNELWATNNGTDNLGDNLPPDTIQIVQQGQDYGWPRCHAGTIPDPQFGGATACNGVAKPLVELQAHSAALGLTFYTGTQFPSDYRGDLFVALHGSIFRSVPTGYKVVRIHVADGQPGPVQDFATGWLLSNGRAWGRPVDVLTAPDGSLFVSDDSGGKIYRIFYGG